MAKTEIVWKNVPLLGQTNSKCCWHTCYKMLYGWRGKPMSDVDRRIPHPGWKGTPTEKGLKPSQWEWACAKMGLWGYPASALKKKDRMAWCIEKCGPIWTTGKFLNGHMHTVVIAGVRLDPDDLLIYDPWGNHPMGESLWLAFSWWSQLVDTRSFACQLWW